jgi:hypothetical protein
MNKAYDYLGTVVSTSKPVQKLRTVKKTVYLDSGDRDLNLYKTNGEFVTYLPRSYERVTSINVKSAEFPAMTGAFTKSVSGATASYSGSDLYFFLTIDGLNKSDETAVGGDKSTFVDSVFAKFQIGTGAIFYTESSGQHIVQNYYPPIAKLDRLKIKTRLHTQQSGESIYWSSQYSLTLEVETLENAFDDFSSMETRLADRS